jgi:hypothetical protein
MKGLFILMGVLAAPVLLPWLAWRQQDRGQAPQYIKSSRRIQVHLGGLCALILLISPVLFAISLSSTPVRQPAAWLCDGSAVL